jgi:spoIIIJ-associated protein
METNLEQIKQTIADFFEKMTIPAEVARIAIDGETVNVSLLTDNSQILIGENGQTLSDLQQIIRLVLRKTINSGFYLNLDINGYKEKKVDKIKDIVREAIDEVIVTGKDKVLSAMTAQERRIVHMEISARDDVKSESIGEEPDRRVVIKPTSY